MVYVFLQHRWIDVIFYFRPEISLERSLDTFEVFTHSSSNKNVASSTYSNYKKHCTAKFLGACDTIGYTWGALVPDAYPGRISDPVLTELTKIMRQVHYGNRCQVDKGFIVENIAMKEGVDIDRPAKKKKKQKQQSSKRRRLATTVSLLRM